MSGTKTEAINQLTNDKTNEYGKKNASQEQLLPSFEEIREHSSLYISIGLLILLTSSFVYNLGYFLFVDVKLLGLLTLGDYYEGTVPYIFIFCTISLLEYIFYLSFSGQNSSIVADVFSLFRCFFIFMRSIRILCKCILNKLLLCIYHRKKNRKFTSKIKYLIKENELCLDELKDILKKNLFYMAILIVFIVMMATPIIGVFLNLKIITLKGVFFVMFFLFPLWMALRDTYKGRKIFTLIIIYLIVLITGINSFKQDYYDKNVRIKFLDDSKTYSLLRSLTNGYIVQYDKDVYFFPKESLMEMKIEKTKEEMKRSSD